MPKKFGRLALHMWTIDTTPLATALDAAKQAGYDAVELRRTDFKRCFDAGMTNVQVLDLIKKSGIPCGVLGVEYGWLFATGDESKRLFHVFWESCENAVALGCDTLMSAPGQVNGPIKDAIFAKLLHREQVHDGADTGVGVLITLTRAETLRGDPIN